MIDFSVKLKQCAVKLGLVQPGDKMKGERKLWEVWAERGGERGGKARRSVSGRDVGVSCLQVRRGTTGPHVVLLTLNPEPSFPLPSPNPLYLI